MSPPGPITAPDETRSTPWRPVNTHRGAQPLRPGEAIPVDGALRPHATRFRAGDVHTGDPHPSYLYLVGFAAPMRN